MAKKKLLNHNPPKPKEFHATPFAALKGVAVAEAIPAPLKQPVVEKKSFTC